MKTYLLARWVLPVARPPLEHAFIAVENDVITEVGLMADLAPSVQEAAAVADYDPVHNRLILTPGLVNTHAHLELSFGSQVEKYRENSMADWLLRVVSLTRKAALSGNADENKRARCRQGALEMLSTGTTCINDISADGTSLTILEALGMRGIVSLEFFHPVHEPVDVQSLCERFDALSQQYDAHSRLQVGLSPHSPYNVSPFAWKKVKERYPACLVHTHLAESMDELLWVQGKKSGIHHLHQSLLKSVYNPVQSYASPTAYLKAYDLLTPPLLAAHCLFVSPSERGFLKKNAIAVAHCPRSNIYLHEQTLQLSDCLSEGVTVSLGTDSHLSTPDLDLRAEARAAMQYSGIRAETVLRMMTLEGAKALNMADSIGQLAVGFKADIAVWDASATKMGLLPEAQVLASETRLSQVWVDGVRLV